MGALIKNVYAPRVLERDPSEVVSVSVMPCTAKKDEAHRPADRQATYSEKLDATVGGCWYGGRLEGPMEIEPAVTRRNIQMFARFRCPTTTLC